MGLGIAATAVVLVARAIATAISGGRASSDLTHLRDQVAEQAAALEETQNNLAIQSTQLSELHERLDFAERMLAQNRDRPPLGPGDKHG